MPVEAKEASEKHNYKDYISDKSEIKNVETDGVAVVRKIKTAPSPVISMYCNNLVGETRTIFTQGPLRLEFEALVIPHIDGATILAGSPFFVQHEFDICYSTCSVKVGRKFSIP